MLVAKPRANCQGHPGVRQQRGAVRACAARRAEREAVHHERKELQPPKRLNEVILQRGADLLSGL